MSGNCTGDHDALWRTTLTSFKALKSLRISAGRTTIIPGTAISGGAGDVNRGNLRTSRFWPWGKTTTVAVKKLRPAGEREKRIRVMASLVRELSQWNTLNHPNILPLQGFYVDEASITVAWIITPWQHQGNILSHVQDPKVTQETRLKWARDTASGLTYLHTLSPPVCHGDIKAENTLLGDSGNAMLCDFGLGKILADNPSGLTTTRTTSYTVRYAAPELLVDGASQTLETDVWAWGCLIFVIMTGQLPYSTSVNEYDVIWAITQHEAPAEASTPAVPDIVKRLLKGCWEQLPMSRITMDVALQSLENRNPAT